MGSQRPNSIVRAADAGKKKSTTLKSAKKGITQKQLAVRSGVPLGRLRRYERGTQAVTLADLVKIARALRRDPLDMVRETLIRSGDHQPSGACQ